MNPNTLTNNNPLSGTQGQVNYLDNTLGLWGYNQVPGQQGQQLPSSYVDPSQLNGTAILPNNNAAITSQYGSIFSGLDAAQQELDRQRGVSEQLVGNNYDSSKQGLQFTHDQSMQNLDQSQQNLNQNKATSLRQLRDTIGGAFNSGLIRLGNSGAGDSSATQQLGYALGQVQNQKGADINQQVGQQQGAINLGRKQVDDQLSQALTQLNNWKANNLLQIASDYQTQKFQIDQRRQTATASEQASLNAQQSQLDQNAAQALATVDVNFNQALQSLGGAGAITSQFQPSITNAGNVQVSPLSYNPNIALSHNGAPVGGGLPVAYVGRRQDQQIA